MTGEEEVNQILIRNSGINIFPSLVDCIKVHTYDGGAQGPIFDITNNRADGLFEKVKAHFSTVDVKYKVKERKFISTIDFYNDKTNNYSKEGDLIAKVNLTRSYPHPRVGETRYRLNPDELNNCKAIFLVQPSIPEHFFDSPEWDFKPGLELHHQYSDTVVQQYSSMLGAIFKYCVKESPGNLSTEAYIHSLPTIAGLVLGCDKPGSIFSIELQKDKELDKELVD